MTPVTPTRPGEFSLTSCGAFGEGSATGLWVRARSGGAARKSRIYRFGNRLKSTIGDAHPPAEPLKQAAKCEAPMRQPSRSGANPCAKALIFETIIQLFGRFQRRSWKQTLPIADLVPPLGSVFTLHSEISSTESTSSRAHVVTLSARKSLEETWRKPRTQASDKAPKEKIFSP